MSLIRLVCCSFWRQRVVSVSLIISIACSVMIVLGVQQLKESVKYSFQNSVSGVDLVVGARTGDIQLFMMAMMRMGRPVANMSWDSVEELRNLKPVKWVVPFSIGDSHRGYHVMGTESHYFDCFKLGANRSISFREGRSFESVFDVVLGGDVAATLGYQLGDEIEMSHDIGHSSDAIHKDKVFTVVGILNRSGTPVDRTLFIGIDGIEALHLDWANGRAPHDSERLSNQDIDHLHLEPDEVTGCFVGLRSPAFAPMLQYQISTWESESLLAIMPRVVMRRLWMNLGMYEKVLEYLSYMMVGLALWGVWMVLRVTFRNRHRDWVLLRALGCGLYQLWLLLWLESMMIVGMGILLGTGFSRVLVWGTAPIFERHLGLVLTTYVWGVSEWSLMGGLFLIGSMVGMVSVIGAYRRSVADGLII